MRSKLLVGFALSLSLGLSLVGCAQSASQTGNDAKQVATATQGLSGLSLPGSALPKIGALPAGWSKLAPGGETLCSDGSEFSFWVKPGDPNKFLFYLQGGGACWFRENCDPAMSPSYTINLSAEDPTNQSGIFDYQNPANPFADYTAVFVPYCSADVHLGAIDRLYPPVAENQQPLKIYHRGMANVQAALDWSGANVKNPQEVFVTGSSAGAIPSPYYAMQLAGTYPDAQVVQLGDGAGGYRIGTSDTERLPHRQWGTIDALRKQPGFEDVSLANFTYESLYLRAAQQQPQITFARYDAAEDAVQKQFLSLMGVPDVALQDSLLANGADIAKAVDRYAGYIAGGDSHTILRRPEFYTYTVGERSVRDWIADLSEHKTVADVVCQQCDLADYLGYPTPKALRDLWLSWEDPTQQYVEPFQIFDNLYYVGIDWVAAYVLQTSDGLILIDALYGKWTNQLYANMRKLGLDPVDIKMVIATHGHFDHAGGAADVQQRFGATVVMSAEDWALTTQPADHPLFAMRMPSSDPKWAKVAKDGDIVRLGDTEVALYETPGHTTGVLSLVYPVRDDEVEHQALTLGGVGLNFTGIPQSQSYVGSYERLVELQQAQNLSVSLPNHAAMGKVFQRGELLAARAPGTTHPFVDAQGLVQDLATFLSRGRDKLKAEHNGTAADPMAELSKAISD